MPEPIPLAPLSALENPDIPPTTFPLARLAMPVPIPPTIPTALLIRLPVALAAVILSLIFLSAAVSPVIAVNGISTLNELVISCEFPFALIIILITLVSHENKYSRLVLMPFLFNSIWLTGHP